MLKNLRLKGHSSFPPPAFLSKKMRICIRVYLFVCVSGEKRCRLIGPVALAVTAYCNRTLHRYIKESLVFTAVKMEGHGYKSTSVLLRVLFADWLRYSLSVL